MTEAGPPSVLEWREMPEPVLRSPTDLKVRLHAAGVNPIDTKVRQRGLFYPDACPAILGCDGAGVVVETGPGVSRFQTGDRVWFCNGGLGGDPGNYVEYTVLDQRWAAAMPRQLSFEQAAAAPLVLITAWGALHDRARLKPGHTVLIHAGAGGVGHVAIQLAKIHGARVLTTVGSPEKSALARHVGANEVIDYRSTDFVEATQALTSGEGADVVFDTVGPEVFRKSIECTRHFGDLVTLLDPGEIPLHEARMRNLRIGFELMLTPMLRNLDRARDHHVEILDRCAAWIDQNLLQVHVSEVLPLAEAAAAHQIIEAGHTVGKIVLKIT